MANVNPPFYVGAEAALSRGDCLGLPAVYKVRLPKAYRHPELDAVIRAERTRSEALLLHEAARAGVRVPRVLDVDLPQATLTLEAIEGKRLRERIDEDPARAPALCREFGRLIGQLHRAGLVHGDLTTANVLVQPTGLVLLDFGLASRATDVEERGVDLHLAERTITSSHPGHEELTEAVRAGYAEVAEDAARVFERVGEIRGRGRYT